MNSTRGRQRPHSPVIDLHVDALLQQLMFGYRIDHRHDPDQSLGWRAWPAEWWRRRQERRGKAYRPYFNHLDIPRMIEANYSCAVFGLHSWPISSEKNWALIQRQLELLDKLYHDHPDYVWVKKPGDIRAAHAANRFAFFPVMEGMQGLGAQTPENDSRRLDRLESLYRRGVRMITLAHFSVNDVAVHRFGPRARPTAGLGRFARAVIRTMNELGMIVDLAHVSDRGVLEACELSHQPAIISHAAFQGCVPNRIDPYLPRAVPDDVADAVIKAGGVIGIMFSPHILAGRRGTIQTVVDQVCYGIDRFGPEAIAYGSDFDGWIPSIPEPMQDVTDLSLVTDAFTDAGLSDEAISGFWGENFLRYWERMKSAL